MKTILRFLFATHLAVSAHAACEPPRGEHQYRCDSCGNLEQNPGRGAEVAWNALLETPEMQRALQTKGLTRVVITGMRHSSRGVLFYFALIRDPSFEIIDTDSYSEMLSLQRELDRGFRGSVDRTGPRGGAEVRWRASLQRRIEAARELAIKTTTKPFEVRLLDQNGREFRNNVRKIPRNNPAFNDRLPGPKDLFANDRYLERDCFDADKRYGKASRGRGGGTGAGGSGADGGSGRGSCNVTERKRCRSDFSNPRGSGTICRFDVTISCA